MRKVTFYFFITFLFLMPLISSADEQVLGTFQMNKCIDLLQTCDNPCSYVNITAITYPNGSTVVQNTAMTADGTFTSFKKQFCDTGQQGTYIYNTVGDPGGTQVSQPVTFTITPTGQQGLLGWYIILFLFAYLLVIIGVWQQEMSIAVLGAFGLCILGIFTAVNGIDAYKNWVTSGFSVLTSAIGFIVIGQVIYSNLEGF